MIVAIVVTLGREIHVGTSSFWIWWVGGRTGGREYGVHDLLDMGYFWNMGLDSAFDRGCRFLFPCLRMMDVDLVYDHSLKSLLWTGRRALKIYA